ncbi:uncharacterized protein JCM6883_001130 [Sporobolomyces salmoneus]|uniref:uncharacterized protein n=1 Tax=Sporobolomyces salmoneus TaxID=183962 RepID=UPI003170B7F4
MLPRRSGRETKRPNYAETATWPSPTPSPSPPQARAPSLSPQSVPRRTGRRTPAHARQRHDLADITRSESPPTRFPSLIPESGPRNAKRSTASPAREDDSPPSSAELSEANVERVEPKAQPVPPPPASDDDDDDDDDGTEGSETGKGPSILDRLTSCQDLGDIETLLSELKEERSYFSGLLNDFEPHIWDYPSVIQLQRNVEARLQFCSFKLSRSIIDLADHSDPKYRRFATSWITVGTKKASGAPQISFADLGMKPALHETAIMMLFILMTTLSSEEEVESALDEPKILEFINTPDDQRPFPTVNQAVELVDEFVATLPTSRGSPLSIYDQVFAILMVHLLDEKKAQLVGNKIVYSAGGHPLNSPEGKAAIATLVQEALHPNLRNVTRLMMLHFPSTSFSEETSIPHYGPNRMVLKFKSARSGTRALGLQLPGWEKGGKLYAVDMVPLAQDQLADRSSRKVGFWNCYDEEFLDWEKGLDKYSARLSLEDQEYFDSLRSRILTAMHWFNEYFKSLPEPVGPARNDALNRDAQAAFNDTYPHAEHALSPKGFHAYRFWNSSTAELRAGARVPVEHRGRLIDELPSIAFASFLAQVGNTLFDLKFDFTIFLRVLVELIRGTVNFLPTSKSASNCMNCSDSPEEHLRKGIVDEVSIVLCLDCLDSLDSARDPDGEGLGYSIITLLAQRIVKDNIENLSRDEFDFIIEEFKKSRNITDKTLTLQEEHLRVGKVKFGEFELHLLIQGPATDRSALRKRAAATLFPTDRLPMLSAGFLAKTNLTGLDTPRRRTWQSPRVPSISLEVGTLRTQFESTHSVLSNARSTAAELHDSCRTFRPYRHYSAPTVSHAAFLASCKLLDEITELSIKLKSDQMVEEPGSYEWYRYRFEYFEAVEEQTVSAAEEKLRALARPNRGETTTDEFILEQYNFPDEEWKRIFSLARDVPITIDPEHPENFPMAFCSDDTTVPSILSPAEMQAENAKPGGWTVRKNKLRLLRLARQAIEECDRGHGDESTAEPPRYRWGNTIAAMFYLVAKQQWKDPFLGPLRLACTLEDASDFGGFGHLQPFESMTTGIKVERPRTWNEFDLGRMNMIFRSFRVTRHLCLTLQTMVYNAQNDAKHAAMKMFGDYTQKLLESHSIVGISPTESAKLSSFISQLNEKDEFRWDRVVRQAGYLTKDGQQVKGSLFGKRSDKRLHYSDLIGDQNLAPIQS